MPLTRFLELDGEDRATFTIQDIPVGKNGVIVCLSITTSNATIAFNSSLIKKNNTQSWFLETVLNKYTAEIMLDVEEKPNGIHDISWNLQITSPTLKYTIGSLKKSKKDRTSPLLEMDETALRSTVRNSSNTKICEEVLKKASSKENPFAARAYRRAAERLALAELPLINKDTTYQKLVNDLGLPNGGSTTKYAWEIISEGILVEGLKADPMLAYPPEWRRGGFSKYDERIMLVLKILKFRIKYPDVKSRDRDSNRIFNEIRDECYAKGEFTIRPFYGNKSLREIKIIYEHIIRSLGFEEAPAAVESSVSAQNDSTTHTEWMSDKLQQLKLCRNVEEKVPLLIELFDYIRTKALKFTMETPRFKDAVIDKCWEMKMVDFEKANVMKAVDDVLAALKSYTPSPKYKDDYAKFNLMRSLFDEYNLPFDRNVMSEYNRWSRECNYGSRKNRYINMKKYIHSTRL